MKRVSRLALVAFLAACGAVLVAPLAAEAIPPATEVTLTVTDCKSGAPISAGTAYFILKGIGAAVVPINAGVVGPIGLGDANYRLIVTSPGYREDDRVIHAIADRPRSGTIPLCLHPVAGSPEHLVVTSYAINITCSSSGEVCDPPFTTTITTNDVTQLRFTSSASNCSTIQVDLSVDGSVYTSDPLAPGESTPNIDFSPFVAATREVSVQATGIPGGCNAGTLTDWRGTLVVITSQPFGPTSRLDCKFGGWIRFTSPAFTSEGDCVSYASIAGKNS